MLNSFELTSMFQSLLKREQIFFTKEDKQDAIKLLTLFQKEEMEANCSTYYEVEGETSKFNDAIEFIESSEYEVITIQYYNGYEDNCVLVYKIY